MVRAIGQEGHNPAGLDSFTQSRAVKIENLPPIEAAKEEPDPSNRAQAASTPAYEAEVLSEEDESAPDAQTVQPADFEPARSPAAQVAEAIFRDALASRASDIHLTPQDNGLSLRLRIDGVLHEKTNFKQKLPTQLGSELIGYLKFLAGIDLAQTARPQVRQFQLRVDDQAIRARLAIFPTIHGERIVIHLLDRPDARPTLAQLDLVAEDQADLRALLGRAGGLIVVAAPVRSQRSYTLRAVLAEMNTAGKNIVVIEKSVACEVEGASHAQVDPHGMFTYADAMAAATDQDADIVMIDDLRDPATAGAALEAALDGATVLAGMRAVSAPIAAATLLEMNLEPWPLASALSAVVAVRCVRRLCPHCRKTFRPDGETLTRLYLQREKLGEAVCQPVGCENCARTGYVGIVGVVAMMRIDPKVVATIRGCARVSLIREAATQAGMKPLRQAAIDLVHAGETALAEVEPILLW